MKVIILAAGKGERMLPLTQTTPKPLLHVNGRPVLDYVFDALPDEVDEAIIAVRHLSHRIKEHLGEEYRGRRIRYVDGSEKGTAFSILAAREHFVDDERFLFMHGDELPNAEDVMNVCREETAVMVFRSERPWVGGVVLLDETGHVMEIEEKPESPKSNVIVGGVMLLKPGVFDHPPRPNAKGEYYFTSMLDQYVRQTRVKAVFSDSFIGDVTAPADLERVSQLVRERDAMRMRAL